MCRAYERMKVNFILQQMWIYQKVGKNIEISEIRNHKATRMEHKESLLDFA